MKITVEKTLSVDARAPGADSINRAAAVIRSGGVVVCPTRGLYGLAVDAFNPAAVEKLFSLKGRDPDKPLLVLIHDRVVLAKLAGTVDPVSRFFMDAFWPGGITLVLHAAEGLPAGLLSGQGKVGVRLVAHPVAAALAAAVQGPITGTSANLSGRGGCAVIADVSPAVLNAADLVLDAGRLEGGPGSTVLDAGGHRPRILRAGVVPDDDIMEAFKRFKAGKP